MNLLLFALLLTQEDPIAKAADRCDSSIAWLTDGAVIRDNARGGRGGDPVETIPVLDKAKTRAKEEGKLILWYIPKMSGPQMYRPALPDAYARGSFFTHPDVVELVNRKFVPMRVLNDRAMSEATKIVRLEMLEPAIVILDPEGAVVHKIDRIRTFSPDWLVGVLVAVLAKNPKLNPIPENATIEDLILGGDYEKALAKKPEPLQAAAIARRQHRGEDALKILKGQTGPEFRVEEGRVLLGLGKIAEAREAFEKSNQSRALNRRSAEAHYYIGACLFLQADEKGADEAWSELVKHHPDSPWAWLGAQNVAKGPDPFRRGAMAHGFEPVEWAPADVLDGTRRPRTKKDVDDVAKQAVEYLLRSQRSNGGWEDARYCWWPDPAITPNTWVAVTAIVATALLEWRSVAPDRIDGALTKAEAYLLDESKMNRGKNEEVYAESFKILYFARKQAKKKDPKNLERISDCAKRLAGLQDKKGFWGHEYPNPFTTASIVQVLAEAKAVGAKFDESMIAKAAEGLLKTRGADGAQAYDSGRRASQIKDSSARVVPCEHALLIADKVKGDDLAKGFEKFWEFRKNIETVRVCDFHTDGELAGFFFFHSLFFTSLGVEALPKKDRAAHYEKLLEWVLSIPEIDGSFVDSHELGKSYATGMALLVIRNCQQK